MQAARVYYWGEMSGEDSGLGGCWGFCKPITQEKPDQVLSAKGFV